jgi:hypothetical protein
MGSRLDIQHARAVGLGDDVHRGFGYAYEEPRRFAQADHLQVGVRAIASGADLGFVVREAEVAC